MLLEMYKFKDRHYYETKKRLIDAQEWVKGFLETEKQITISDKVSQAMATESPFTFKVAQLVMLPTICLSYLKKILIWRSFKNVRKKYNYLERN